MQNPGNPPLDDSLLIPDAEQRETEEVAVSAAQAPVAGEPQITRAQLSLGKRLLNWRTLVPLVIVLGLLAYSAQKLQINPGQTWAAMRSANVVLLLVALFIYYCSFAVRTLRWRLLLENVGYTKTSETPLPSFGPLLEILYISWFANAIVPAKLGDLYRAYLLHQEAGVSATRTFGTVLAERLLDLSVLLVLFFLAIIISLRETLPSFLRTGLYVTLAIVALGIVALVLLRSFYAQFRRLVPQRFQGYYDHLHHGTLGSFKRLPLLVPLTVVVWLCEAGRFFCVALSLNLIGGGLLQVGAASLFIALGEALLTAVPLTGGGIGLVEGGMIVMITLFTPAHNLAAAAVLLDRTISLLTVMVFGLIVFLIASGRQATRRQIKA